MTQEEINRQIDRAFVLGARFGWNCAAEEWEPSAYERSMSPDTWAKRDAIRAARREKYDAAIAARTCIAKAHVYE